MNPIAVHARNPGPLTGPGNTTWLIPGRVPVLIDAGPADGQFLDELASALGSTRLARVLVTHGHSDHAGGAPAIAARMPHVRFAKMPWPERDHEFPVPWEPLRNNESIEAGDESLVAVHTPGHAPDHLCFWHQRTRTLFCGDLASAGTTVVVPANYGGDLMLYLASLERVLALAPARMLPAHGPVIENPAELLRQYLEHRHAREQQVLAALRAGLATPDAIVASVYEGLSPALVDVARESILSHLVKLQREGRVRAGEDGWTII